LEEAQSRYLGTVMRRAVGDRLRLFNGRDGEWQARIVTLGKRGVLAEAEAMLRPQAPEPDHWLLLSIIKREALEWAVEKATELGASEIHLLITARSRSGLGRAGWLRAIAIEAADGAPPCRCHRARRGCAARRPVWSSRAADRTGRRLRSEGA
jgi:16S rRNA (uracil1498-N3)-methyltransferase